MSSATVKLLNIITIILLILALFEMPYGYYIFLRIVVFISALLNIPANYRKQKTEMIIIYGLIAVLFNPIIVVFFERESWMIIDIVVAGIYGFDLYKSYARNSTEL